MFVEVGYTVLAMGSVRDRGLAPRDFVEKMTLPVWEASSVVRWLEGRVANVPKQNEDSPAKAALTHGDCVAQEILLTALREQMPWVAIDAEEDTPTARFFLGNRSDYTAVVDPIDGTLRYLQRDGLYAILLGLEYRGRVEASIVGIPQRGLLIRAVRGQGAEYAHEAGSFQPLHCDGDGNRLLVSHELPPGVAERLAAEGFELVKAAGGVIGVAPLLEGTTGAIRTTSQPQGVSRRTWISMLATLEVGGVVEALRGPLPERYRSGIEGVIVAANASAVARLRKLL